jgi:hypothetical protein
MAAADVAGADLVVENIRKKLKATKRKWVAA